MQQEDHLELIAATFSPMDEAGSIHCAPVEAYAEYLLSHHVRSVFINGTTGESHDRNHLCTGRLCGRLIRHDDH